ncbi:putative ferric-chelate reductase [Martiniozyma asiatica (nom. inval.)]|nr:putative ferric-chelate reductase [Martiniozyma asiatica]
MMDMGTSSNSTGGRSTRFSDLFEQGVWCIGDVGTDKYATLKKQSQNAVSWASQEAYGHYLIYFCVVIVTLFIIKRIIAFSVDKSSKLSMDESNAFKKLYYKYSAFARFVSYRRFPRFMCEIFQLPSSFGNFIIIIIGCLFILCYTFIPKFWYRECRGFGSPPLAVRAGLQATALMPIIFMLSGKTNLISQLTGISYEKINVYHRWTSLACCFLSWVHTIPFYIQAVREGGLSYLAYKNKTDNLYLNGIPPLVFVTILTIFSHSYIRALWYELWLQIHWICGLGMYISLFYHAALSLDGWKYLVATIVFWMAQLTWRGFSKNFFKPNNGFMRSNPCKMKRLSSSDKDHYFEIIVDNKYGFSWSPGQHLYLRIPGLRFLENHPFSIMSYFEPRQNTDIKLIVKASSFGGLTKLIYDKLPDEGYRQTTVFIDGPYGGAEREIDAFTNAYLLSSGTGVTAVLPFLAECISKLGQKGTLIKNVKFDWVVRSGENVEWIVPEMAKIISQGSEFIQSGNVEINIHVTEELAGTNDDAIRKLIGFESDKATSDTESSDSDSKSTNLEKVEAVKCINVYNSKPDVDEMVRSLAPGLSDRNMFVVSGSDSFKISVSNAVASLQKEVWRSSKVKEVYLHSESFGW